ncbi:MAG TPA: orotate phosphoribosyltransferase [Candidatus Thermoplasmatota archaeon]|nr:orotate phosphoribosyltransferase [Candidatus Thermoplasmatota archaeon]
MNTKELVDQLKSCGAIQYGHFVLTSGAVSDYYVDIKKASTNPGVLNTIATQMKNIIKNKYDLIAGMELGAVPLIVALSLQTNIPFVIVRKQKRDHGTGKQIEGESVKDKKVLIIEDVTTSGGSVVNTIQILRQNNATLDKVITVVDRESGAQEKIEKLNLEFHPLVTVNDILKKKDNK